MASFPRADVVIGGPPCQGFSPLNRDAVGFERRGLWREYLRALEQARPGAFVMENVPELLRSAEYAEFKRRAERGLGFTVEGRILNAADFGVPQRRRRAIVIGVLSGEVPWPEPTHADPRTLESIGRERRGGPFARRSRGCRSARTGGTGIGPAIRARRASAATRPFPATAGTGSRCSATSTAAGLGDLVPRCWREKPTGTTDVFGRLWWDRPAYTIRTEFYKPEKGRYLHPSAHRPITVREAARCMSFPRRFRPARGSVDDECRPPDRQRGASAAGAAIAEGLAEHLDASAEPAEPAVPAAVAA